MGGEPEVRRGKLGLDKEGFTTPIIPSPPTVLGCFEEVKTNEYVRVAESTEGVDGEDFEVKRDRRVGASSFCALCVLVIDMSDKAELISADISV
jgi:hypothetical protein